MIEILTTHDLNDLEEFRGQGLGLNGDILRAEVRSKMMLEVFIFHVDVLASGMIYSFFDSHNFSVSRVP